MSLLVIVFGKEKIDRQIFYSTNLNILSKWMIVNVEESQR